MSVLTPVLNFARDFVSDLKSSRRFQVCVVLWLPLVITALVCVVRLGIKNTFARQFPQWNTFFIPESTGITYPDVYVNFSWTPSSVDPSFTVKCTQRGNPVPAINCPTTFMRQPSTQCQVLKMSGFQASQSYRGQNHIGCNFVVNVNGGAMVNQEMAISFAQGYVWFPNPPTYFTPNAYVRVDLFRDLFHPMGGPDVFEWGTWLMYQSSVFNNPPQPNFNMTVNFDIPFRALAVHRQDDIFDNWQLLAAWGGFFTFMAFLHAIVFFFVKLYTPNDSKLLSSGIGAPSGPQYEPIK